MIVTIASWCYIALILYVLGFSATHYYYKRFGFAKELDIIVAAGLCCMIAISQWMSLFMGLGMAANAILLVVVVGLAWWQRRELVVYSKGVLKAVWKPRYLVLGGILCAVIAYWAAQMPIHYDTYLYHAQAIRWIEEYGVVKGLGNLNNRFAYNSAIFCLQAFFGFHELGDSLHSVNGFIAVIALYYAATSLSIWKGEKFQASDFLKLAMFLYAFKDLQYELISSPASDMPSMLGVLYITIKCFEYYEKGTEEYERYAVLSLFAVAVVAIKLSAAFMVCIVMYPAFMLLKECKWKDIFVYIGVGVLLIAPFLLRNIIISGYLVYPYSSVDLFDFDWEMLRSVVEYDEMEISVRARELYDITKYEAGITEWFPLWYAALSSYSRNVFLVSVAAVVMNIGCAIYRSLYKKDYVFPVLVTVSMISYVMWLTSAPRVRYGVVYMMIPTCIALGYLTKCVKKQILYTVAAGLVVYLMYIPTYLCVTNFGNPQLKSVDYADVAYTEMLVSDTTIYIPESGDQGGYDPFPNAPYPIWLAMIEMRGDGLEDGFRVQEEYLDMVVKSNGVER